MREPFKLIFIAMAAARIENASKMQQINPVAIDAVSLSLSLSLNSFLIIATSSRRTKTTASTARTTS
jgi:hypothetical protein